jgi:hypothetical protein
MSPANCTLDAPRPPRTRIVGRSLADTHPHLVTEWDPAANDRQPTEVTAGSHYRAHWVCAAGHHWQAMVFNRAKGSRCPYCLPGRRATSGANDLATTHPQLAAEWDTELNDRTPAELGAGSDYRAHWVCEAGHRWQAVVYARARGSGCPRCVHRPGRRTQLILGVTDLATTHPALVAEWDAEANDRTPAQVTAGSGYRAHWVCEAGHRWQARVFNRTRDSGCPHCSGRRAIAGVTDLATLRPDLAAEWDTAANDRQPHQVTLRSNHRAHWVCAVGHRWQAEVANRTRGSSCPYCSPGAKPLTPGVNDLSTTHPDLVAEWDLNLNDRTPAEVSAGSHYRAHWRCAAGHQWRAAPHDRTRGSGCPHCARRPATPRTA